MAKNLKLSNENEIFVLQKGSRDSPIRLQISEFKRLPIVNAIKRYLGSKGVEVITSLVTLPVDVADSIIPNGLTEFERRQIDATIAYAKQNEAVIFQGDLEGGH